MNRVRRPFRRPPSSLDAARPDTGKSVDSLATEMANIAQKRARLLQEMDMLTQRSRVTGNQLALLTDKLAAMARRMERMDPAFGAALRKADAKPTPAEPPTVLEPRLARLRKVRP